MQQRNDADFCRQIFLELNMDASAPVNSRVVMRKHIMRKYLVDSGLTEVVKPGGQQYTQKHGKVFGEAMAAVIEPLGFRRKVRKNAFRSRNA